MSFDSNDKVSALPKPIATLPKAKSLADYSAPAILDLGESKDFFQGSYGKTYDNSITRGGSTASVLN